MGKRSKLTRGATPGQVDDHDGNVVAAALVDGSAGQNRGGDARGCLAAGATLLRAS